jgi:hypothetical protein
LRRNVTVLALCFVLVLVSSALFADSFVLSGNYLNVGVSNSGGLVDDATSCGIQFDPAGGGSYGPSDFVAPGVPFEFWSLGLDTAVAGPIFVSSGNALLASAYPALSNGNPLNMVTTNTSSGSTLSAHSVGTWEELNIGVTQDLWFDTNESTIHFHTAITNSNEADIQGAFARGADPDQDANTYFDYTTLNTIPSANSVTAVGPESGLYITLIDEAKYPDGIPSIGGPSSDWPTDPFFLFNTPPNDGDGDNSINLAWSGLLQGGQTVDLYYAYKLGPTNPVPEPCTLSLLGLGAMGLLGLRRRKQ